MADLGEDIKKLIGEDCFQFYRCYNCTEVISAMQMAVALKKSGKICACGSMKVIPAEVKPGEYTRKNVIEMAVMMGVSEDAYLDDFRLEKGDSEITIEDIALIRSRWETVVAEIAATCN